MKKFHGGSSKKEIQDGEPMKPLTREEQDLKELKKKQLLEKLHEILEVPNN